MPVTLCALRWIAQLSTTRLRMSSQRFEELESDNLIALLEEGLDE